MIYAIKIGYYFNIFTACTIRFVIECLNDGLPSDNQDLFFRCSHTHVDKKKIGRKRNVCIFSNQSIFFYLPVVLPDI